MRPCKLRINARGDIVAEGSVHYLDGNDLLHGQLLRDDCYRVSVDVLLTGSALIPYECGGMKTVEEANGSFVPWPKEFVIFHSDKQPPCQRTKIQKSKGEKRMQWV